MPAGPQCSLPPIPAWTRGTRTSPKQRPTPRRSRRPPQFSARPAGHPPGRNDWQKPASGTRRANFNDTPSATLLPSKKARAGQSHTTGPICLSPDNCPKDGLCGSGGGHQRRHQRWIRPHLRRVGRRRAQRRNVAYDAHPKGRNVAGHLGADLGRSFERPGRGHDARLTWHRLIADLQMPDGTAAHEPGWACDGDCAGLPEILAQAAASGNDRLAEARRELRRYLLGPENPDAQTRFADAVEALAERVERSADADPDPDPGTAPPAQAVDTAPPAQAVDTAPPAQAVDTAPPAQAVGATRGLTAAPGHPTSHPGISRVPLIGA